MNVVHQRFVEPSDCLQPRYAGRSPRQEGIMLLIRVQDEERLRFLVQRLVVFTYLPHNEARVRPREFDRCFWVHRWQVNLERVLLFYFVSLSPLVFFKMLQIQLLLPVVGSLPFQVLFFAYPHLFVLLTSNRKEHFLLLLVKCLPSSRWRSHQIDVWVLVLHSEFRYEFIFENDEGRVTLVSPLLSQVPRLFSWVIDFLILYLRVTLFAFCVWTLWLIWLVARSRRLRHVFTLNYSIAGIITSECFTALVVWLRFYPLNNNLVCYLGLERSELAYRLRDRCQRAPQLSPLLHPLDQVKSIVLVGNIFQAIYCLH